MERSLVDRATLGDTEALILILRQFIDPSEPIEWCEYLGTLGIQPFGMKSFAVLTRRRVGTLRVGWFGMVEYQDAPLEYTVSVLIVQPSKLGLYVLLISLTLTAAFVDYAFFQEFRPSVLGSVLFALISAALLALIWSIAVRLYYAINKCGMLLAVREGLWVYAFANRGRMKIANRFYRRAIELREARIREVRPVP